MRKKGKVSVIVPVYNVQNYLKRCVLSIRDQSYKDLEIILIDDGSTDNSSEICDELAEEDDRIRVIHKVNGGLADARNAGLEIAKGEYISFVDSDDYISNLTIEKMLESCKENRCQIAICGRYDVYAGITKMRFCIKKPKIFEGDEILKAFFMGKVMNCSSCDKLFHSSIIRGLYFPKGRTAEDMPFVYNALRRANRIIHIAEPMYYYCHRKNSITTQPFTRKRLDYLYFVEKIEKNIWKYDNFKFLKEFYVLYAESMNYLNDSLNESIHKDKTLFQYKILLKVKSSLRLVMILANSYLTSNEKMQYIKNIFI